jgi:predicted Zn-dependent protease
MNFTAFRPLLLISITCLSGCQLLPVKQSAPPALPNQDVISAVSQLQAKGRYGQAIELLESAITTQGKSDAYIKLLQQVRLKQTIQEQELHDQLLISKTSALKNQVPILEQLARSSPDNAEYKEQLEETQQQLLQLRKRLSECGWRHFRKNNGLAKECLTIALSLEQEEQDLQLMSYLIKEQHQIREKTETTQKARREMAWKHRTQQQMDEANRLFESGQLTEARRVLQAILQEDPKNKAATTLLTSVESRLKSYLENLLSAGDRLYREGEIEGAKATWRAALTLDPQDKRAREKIERAQRVLDNMESLRKNDPQRQ